MNITVVRQAPPNPRAAVQNRRMFDTLAVTCVNVLGPAGVGKTALLEAIVPRMRDELRLGVIEGDLASTHDAQRLAALDVPVVQVLTDGACHLSAAQVQAGAAELPLADLDLLFVENIGNPICPAAVDLGEHLRLAVLSVAGGEAVATKYPLLFREAAVILLSQYDLLAHVPFDLDGTVHALRRLNPLAEIICIDTRNRVGIDRLAGWLLGYVRAQRMRQLRGKRAGAGTPAGATR